MATVEEDSKELVGKPFSVRANPAGPIQLIRIGVNVENVLKGDVPLGKNQVFYYSAAAPHGPNAIGFSFRDVLFLRRDKGQLRMAADITAGCSAVVNSGRHPGFGVEPKRPLREALVDLLLTRGDGATDAGMVRAIFDWTANEISPGYTAKSLLRLATSDAPVVRTAACLEFRDIMARAGSKNKESGSYLGKEFGIDPSELDKWQRQHSQNGWAKDWWAHDISHGKLPSALMAAGSTMDGLDLCRDDRALGVPPLRTDATPAHQP